MQLMQVSECCTDVQQLVVVKEEVPTEQNDWSPSLEQEDPMLPHVKEEQEELWTNQEGEQLQGLKEGDITEVSPSFVLKIEEDEEKLRVSQLHPIQFERNREDCRGSEPHSIFHPRRYLQTFSNIQAQDSSDTEDSEDWTPSSEPESHFNRKTKPLASSSTDGEEFGGSESAINLVCIKDIKSGASLNSVRPFSMSKCRRTFDSSLERHMDTTIPNTPSEIKNDDFMVRDVGGKRKRHHCPECGKTFTLRSDLKRHMRVHTGEKPFGCSECGTRFTQKSSLDIHTRVHTGEKPFSCSVCKKCFSDKSNFRTHMATHTGEKQFGCLICGKRFSVKSSLDTHTRVHTGEKPFSCSVCKKCFSQKSHVQKHMKIHKRQKAISLCVSDDQHNPDNQELGLGDMMEYTV